MQVLCCGTRRWNDPILIKRWLEQLQVARSPITILVGDNREKMPKGIIGADFFIAEIGYELDYDVRVFPALWGTHGRAAGPIRNRQMIQRQPDLVLAFRCDGESFGTDGVVQMALDQGIPTIQIHSDGTHENLKKPGPVAEQLEMFTGDEGPEGKPEPAWMQEILNGAL